MTALRFALFPNSKKRPKTLVNEFYYPKKAPACYGINLKII